jgi:hypothetical protein
MTPAKKIFGNLYFSGNSINFYALNEWNWDMARLMQHSMYVSW